MTNKQHTVNIPQSYLLTLAAHGNMGDGELPTIMRMWAQKECERLGLANEMRKLQSERIEELRQRVSNVMGADAMGAIDQAINTTLAKLNS